MARRFGRRRGRGLWFPTDASNTSADIVVADAGVHQFLDPFFNAELDAPTNTTVLAGDTAGGAEAGLLPLLEQPGYAPKRIVGTAFAAINEVQINASSWALQTGFLADPYWNVHFGIFVTQVDTVGNSLNFAAWNAFLDASQQKRFLFERTWILEGRAMYEGQRQMIGTTPANNASAALPRFPHNNVEYPNMSNHRVDIRPKVRVGYEERLWQQWTVQLVNFVGLPFSGAQAHLTVCTRFRMFATPIRNAKR